jgi:uncharacterized protein YukE
MSETYAGITVPEGEPDGLRSAAGRFHGLSGSLEGTEAELNGMPAALSSWQGPASVLYANSCMSQAAGVRACVTALDHAASAARTFAHALEDAQRDAREAIRDARDAQHRIDAAERAIADAQGAQQAASQRADQASHALAMSSAAGVPSPAAQADLDAASADGAAAADREAAARRDLERAQDDLERAKRRGEQAEERAKDAADAATAAFEPVVPPPAPGAGAGASGVPGTPVSAGGGWWSWDDFFSTLYPFHPKNDGFLQKKWFVDQGTGFGAGLAEELAFAAAGGARALATTPWLRTTVTTGSWLTTAGGRLVSAGTFTRITQTLEPPPPGVVSQATSAASRMSKLGWAARGGGVVLAGISGGVEQWHNDAGRTDLTTTDRVGRAAGVGTYMAGAAATGAVIGSVIPGAGTLTGAAIGAGVGLAMGAAANAWTPGKEWAANAGQTVANAAVDTYDGAKDLVNSGIDHADQFLDSAGQNIADGVTGLASDLDKAADLLPDVDMPDLNPF